MMGSDFELIACCDQEAEAVAYLQAGVTEIARIERLLTEFDESSQTSLINRNAGIGPVTVDAEVYQLIERCIRLSELSQGAFDITAGALKSLYRFQAGSLYTGFQQPFGMVSGYHPVPDLAIRD